MKNYLETLLTEKNIDLEETIVIETTTNFDHIYTYQTLIDDIVEMTKDNKQMQSKIRGTFVQIDFMNGDVTHYFKHLAQGIVAAYGVAA